MIGGWKPFPAEVIAAVQRTGMRGIRPYLARVLTRRYQCPKCSGTKCGECGQLGYLDVRQVNGVNVVLLGDLAGGARQ